MNTLLEQFDLCVSEKAHYVELSTRPFVMPVFRQNGQLPTKKVALLILVSELLRELAQEENA